VAGLEGSRRATVHASADRAIRRGLWCYSGWPDRGSRLACWNDNSHGNGNGNVNSLVPDYLLALEGNHCADRSGSAAREPQAVDVAKVFFGVAVSV
jgi:hypothetical protein